MDNSIKFEGTSFNKSVIQGKTLSQFKEYMKGNPHLLNNDSEKVSELFNLVHGNDKQTFTELPATGNRQGNIASVSTDKPVIGSREQKATTTGIEQKGRKDKTKVSD